MYGYRQQSNDGGLMTNLNSISSSLSSMDTIGRQPKSSGNKNSIYGNNYSINDQIYTNRSSTDNLRGQSSQSTASLLWRTNNNARGTGSKYGRTMDRQPVYSNTIRSRDDHNMGSEIYFTGGKKRSYGCLCCLNPETALNLTLVPLLLLTIIRQVFDFMGQIWLQIIINFFTIIVMIVALFGIKQRRISYLTLYSSWALHNSIWNLIVVCIHSKFKDIGLSEDLLSLYSGATSWWHSNGPGCLPYNINSYQPSISILQQDIMIGCRLDYHLIETTQAAIHAILSLLSSLLCCCLIASIKKNPNYSSKNHETNSDKIYRLNDLNQDRSRVNPDPSIGYASTTALVHSASLRRAPNKSSSRSSQHSVSSMRSARRRRLVEAIGTHSSRDGTLRSQKYGSLSSRRSANKVRDRRGENSSLTYGTTGDRPPSKGPRTRLSSLSSADYLPSYQPPHSSSANLLNSYGEISSIDSYGRASNQPSNRPKGAKSRQTSIKSAVRGNTNPTYNGSRSSICSQNTSNTLVNSNTNGTTSNNYDDLSYIYGNNNVASSDIVSAPSSSGLQEHARQHQMNQTKDKLYGHAKRNGAPPFKLQEQPQRIVAEFHQPPDNSDKYMNNMVMAKQKASYSNGFHTFSGSNNLSLPNGKSSSENKSQREVFSNNINNNNIDAAANYHDINDQNQRYMGQPSAGSTARLQEQPRTSAGDGYDGNGLQVNAQQQVYGQQRNQRQPIYLNQPINGNSETPM